MVHERRAGGHVASVPADPSGDLIFGVGDEVPSETIVPMTELIAALIAAWETAAIAVTLLMSAYLIVDLLVEIARPRTPRRLRRNVRLPMVSVVLPVYDEPEDVLRATLASWKQVRYPAFEVIVADDSTLPFESDDPSIRILHRSDRDGFKGGALRNALDHLDPASEWMIIFDADFLVDPDVLIRFACHFAPGVGGVQGFQGMGRNDSAPILTRFCEACHIVSNVLLAGRYRMRGFVGVQGTVEAYRVEAIRSIGGLAPYTTANEDLDTTFRLRKAGWRIVYDPEIVGRGIAPERYSVFFRQTTRWTSSTVREYRRHWPSYLRSRHVPIAEKIDSFFFLLTWTNSLVVTPTLVFLPWVLMGLNVIPLWLSVLITVLPLTLFALPLLIKAAPVRLALTGWMWYYVLLVPGYVVMFRASLLGLFGEPGFTRTTKFEHSAKTGPSVGLTLSAKRVVHGKGGRVLGVTCRECGRRLPAPEVLFYAVGGLDVAEPTCRRCIRRYEWIRFTPHRRTAVG